ncbi:unnamed protein product [Macrosiphum euphorbiae]|uniref:Uncharacterized protein n=1 Tax=Macrosiphum euphorbiae TaxID=13131 RepID=A0AAV0WY53_9HEMI|nr:unnamed protein product [Macrosiphum euphorbiae]
MRPCGIETKFTAWKTVGSLKIRREIDDRKTWFRSNPSGSRRQPYRGLFNHIIIHLYVCLPPPPKGLVVFQSRPAAARGRRPRAVPLFRWQFVAPPSRRGRHRCCLGPPFSRRKNNRHGGKTVRTRAVDARGGYGAGNRGFR